MKKGSKRWKSIEGLILSCCWGAADGFASSFQLQNTIVNPRLHSHPEAFSSSLPVTEPQTTSPLFQYLDHRIHLLSLQWPDDDNDAFVGASFSARSSVRDIWKWKDRVLGDGRDFFVPKPRILTALQEWILQQTTPYVEECAVLSNCARFEVLLVLSSNDTTTHDYNLQHEVIPRISACFQAQVDSNRRQSMKRVWLDPLSAWDWPGMIDSTISIANHHCNNATASMLDGDVDDDADISHAWTCLHGVHVVRHLSLVAAGMALRPSRPNRPVPFRPFSARDAHVMLQLKRTHEIFGTTPCLGLLLETALRAGKAARTVACVPELERLLQYGTGNSKYEAEPPDALMLQVAEAARVKAIEPMVMECVAKFKAMQASKAIAELRRKADALLVDRSDPTERRWMQQQLHLPTMLLRNGEPLDIPTVLTNLEMDLQKKRLVDRNVNNMKT